MGVPGLREGANPLGEMRFSAFVYVMLCCSVVVLQAEHSSHSSQLTFAQTWTEVNEQPRLEVLQNLRGIIKTLKTGSIGMVDLRSMKLPSTCNLVPVKAPKSHYADEYHVGSTKTTTMKPRARVGDSTRWEPSAPLKKATTAATTSFAEAVKTASKKKGKRDEKKVDKKLEKIAKGKTKGKARGARKGKRKGKAKGKAKLMKRSIKTLKKKAAKAGGAQGSPFHIKVKKMCRKVRELWIKRAAKQKKLNTL